MEKRDYDLELIRMEFMDGVSQIATEAWESQKPAALEINLGQVTEEQRKQHYKNMDDAVLIEQRWWVEKQSEFVSKLIADYKSNIFFRQIAQNSENDLMTINEILKNQNVLTAFLKNEMLGRFSDNSLASKHTILSHLVNRCFTLKDDNYKTSTESMTYIFIFSLLEYLLTSFVSGDYGDNERNKHTHCLRYFSFLPMHLISGGVMTPNVEDLTYFTKYFECYCKFITKLLKIKERLADKTIFDKNMSYQDFVKTIPMEEPNDNTVFDKNMSYQDFLKTMNDKMGGRKKTRKYRKRTSKY